MLKLAGGAMALLLLGASAVPSAAISRYMSSTMTCSEVQARIAREGAAIMRYRSQRQPDIVLYDRYVAHDDFCPFGQETVRDHIPSADRAACPVLRCRPAVRERDFRRIWPRFGD